MKTLTLVLSTLILSCSLLLAHPTTEDSFVAAWKSAVLDWKGPRDTVWNCHRIGKGADDIEVEYSWNASSVELTRKVKRSSNGIVGQHINWIKVTSKDPDSELVLELLQGDKDFYQSKVSIQITTAEFYQEFPSRAVPADVHGMLKRVASVEDTLAGKIAAFTDSSRRPSKRQKDLADISRLLESHPHLQQLIPVEVLSKLTF